MANHTCFNVNIKSIQIRTIAIIAEGIPENLTRQLVKKAKEKGVCIIGPATVITKFFWFFVKMQMKIYRKDF